MAEDQLPPQWRIALADVSIGDEEIAAVTEVLRSGWLSMGPTTEHFEQALGDYLGAEHVLAVTNGTAALHLAAAALGIGPGDEVICPSLTFVASAAAMLQTGATVRLADSTSLDDFSLNPDEIDRLAGPRTRAVVVVHYGGYPAAMEEIMARCRARELLVIEDAAHAPGAAINGRSCGTIGDAGCFSFFPNKNMTTGEGGAVVFADEKAASKARLLRSHAMTALTWDRHLGHANSYDVLDVGFNYRIDEIRAALGLVQLARLDTMNASRARLATLYRLLLADQPSLVVPGFGARGRPVHHLAVALAPRDSRDRVRQLLRGRGIQTSVHYPAIHRFSHYRQTHETELPVAEEIAERVITLPLHPRLGEAEIREICEALVEAVADNQAAPN